jgi:armadillo repeat-containing protein 8
MLAVPLALSIVRSVSEGSTPDNFVDGLEQREVREQACEVLSLLIKDSKELQQAAVEAKAVKYVCQLLKKSFDNVTIAKPVWSPKSSTMDGSQLSDSRKMGSKGLPPEIIHVMRCRKGALLAIAALTRKEDLHRKAAIESGVINCIMDSLKPFPPSPPADTANRGTLISPKDGNTKPVLLAACAAVRAMSRSVSILRTSLIDAGVAKPIYELLQTQDLEIKIATTNALCNLVLDFSPSREELLSNGIIGLLGSNARQSEMELRHASMWALKHLVLKVNRDMKLQCLEDLGTGWLVGAIQGDHSANTTNAANGGGVSIGGPSTLNAAGEKVELLNPASMDVDDPEEEHDGEEDDDEDGEVMYDEASSTHYQSSQLRSTLKASAAAASSIPQLNAREYLNAMREMERDPILQAKRMDVNIQEQALDFLRNLFNGDDCTYMVEHVLSQIGSDKFFSLITEKLIPVGNMDGPQKSRPVYQPATLIHSAVHVLLHVANATPRHKSLLIAQTPLLRALYVPAIIHPASMTR